ncbi:MAG: HAD-superfamily hydrolase, subfamily variant 3 [Candidatus Saccharibacteria bacterium]|nr:HAD-superfamily hydrolase, subfamily variant 3 [Candidatus Saccharibacteria bacterium]
MIILLDTSTPVCKLALVEGDWRYDNEWEANRELAKGLLGYLQTEFEKNGKTWTDISGIVAFRGPGSFTGLRIGLTVLNTLADGNHLPIVGTHGDDWQTAGLARLEAGEDDKIVLPEYGGEAHITLPRK